MYKLILGLEAISNTTSPVGKDWYHEVDRNSKQLLITAGDSWTWGNSLDSAQRTKQIYGSLLSNKLNYDWVNIGLPGESNLVVKDYLSKVIKNLTKTYEDIVVIVTLTESTRDLVSLDFCENNYNFIKGESWPDFKSLTKDNISVLDDEFPDSHILDVVRMHLALQNCNSIKSTMEIIENTTVDIIKQLLLPNSTKLILARNFTSWTDINNSSAKDTWTEVISKIGNLQLYPTDLYFVTSTMGSNRLVSYQDKFNRIVNFKQDLLDQLEKAQSAIDWLEKSPYNSNFSTKHPLATGHKWWADYLYDLV